MDIRNLWRDDDYDTDIGVSSFADFINTRGGLASAPRQLAAVLPPGDLAKLTDYIETKSGEPRYKDSTARMNIALTEKFDVSFGGRIRRMISISGARPGRLAPYRYPGTCGPGQTGSPAEALRNHDVVWLEFERKRSSAALTGAKGRLYGLPPENPAPGTAQ